MIAQIVFPVSVAGTFDYLIPEELRDHVTIGSPVLVELRKRKLWGIVLEIVSQSTFKNLKPILDAKSLSEKELLELDDLKDRMNSHFDFFLASSVHSKEEIKDWFGNNDSK